MLLLRNFDDKLNIFTSNKFGFCYLIYPLNIRLTSIIFELLALRKPAATVRFPRVFYIGVFRGLKGK